MVTQQGGAEQGNFIRRTLNFLLTTWIGRAILALGLIGAGIGVGLTWWLVAPTFLAGEEANEELVVAPAPTTDGGGDTAGMQAVSPAPATGDEPVLVRTGEFNQIDRFHAGHGLANIYRLPDGSHVLQLEDAPGDVRTFSTPHGPAGEEVMGWEVTNGPQLAVYLSSNTGHDSTGGIDLGEYVNVRNLGGVTSGTLSIPLDADINIDDYNSVLIWCVPFRVNFSAADLQAP